MAEKETKHVSMGMAILTLLIVAAIMAVGLAVLKIDTMVTFILVAAGGVHYRHLPGHEA